MKAICFGLALAAILFGGCESLSRQVSEKFEARGESRMRTFAAPPRATYEAVRVALGQMDYRVLRGGAAQGELEAVNTVAAGDSLRGAQQISMKVRLHPTLDEKGTEVTVWLTEILEGDSTSHAGLATSAPLRDTPQYEVFFRSVQQALNAQTGAAK
ncbi:MAG TPA: hypothetical protein VHD62_11270 [Opitutaceae bacterium]|nr:hypothetical protein [Opitutaceae bacterium]